MNKSDWQQAQELFGVAAALKEPERSRFVERIGERSRLLQSEVASLLSADELREILPHSAASDFLFDSDTDDSIANRFGDMNQAFAREQQIVGEQVGERYLIVKKLGGGGMGDVFLALDKNLVNREVVVKLLRSEVLENKEATRKFRQEVEALARVKDENIVTIYDFGTHGETPFLVMEYVAGEDLSKIISPVLFSARDFAAPERFASEIIAAETRPMRFLRDKLSAAVSQTLANKSAGETATILRDNLSKLLGNWSLYDAKVFSDVRLSDATKSELERAKRDGKTMRFNRLLLEDAFSEFVKPGLNKRLTAAETATVFRQLGIALAHGHEKGIIHRDLKPANIMICESAARGLTVKLIDFGVAKVRESLVAPTTELGAWFGTQDYMSPEQLRGERNLTEASDIYALGLIAYETVAGRRAFDPKTPIEQYKLQESEQLESLAGLRPDLPASVEAVIRRALKFKPENRFANAAEFGEALAAALNDKRELPFAPETNFDKPLAFAPETAQTPANSITANSTNASSTNANSTNANPANAIPISPAQAAPFETRKEAEPVKTRSSAPKILGAIAAVLLIGLLVAGGLWRRNRAGESNANQAITNEIVRRELSYKLIVQKYYDGKPYQEPFEATGDEIFGDGWRFKLWLKSEQNGFLYLLSETAAAKLIMLFPHPQKNNGAATIRANQATETSQVEFNKNQGTEKFWIVWSEKPVAELEAAKKYVNPKDLGAIADESEKAQINRFLREQQEKNKVVEKTEQTAGRLKKLEGSADVLVKLAEFRHN